MNTSLRRQVLECFKRLHRTREMVFRDDSFALQAARSRINEEYKKNKHITNAEAIHEMIKLSKAVEEELKTSVVQACEVEHGKYELRILPDTKKIDNIPFQDCKN
ncbi:complex III assembly factor LYRM7 [Cryptotermes secundus]|uniref:complex III assembly factor LYRM7 n=1 Tax=Cryptotermes secundus TaxID=105785 RepID=UPI000CD7BBE5|nr:complex III assembly factor LYRM7 [Cryptotermes secundus]